MRLIIGGYAQGKLKYALFKYQLREDAVWSGRMPEDTGPQEKTAVFYRFHVWVKERILAGGCPEEEIQSFLDRKGNCIIISDEIGNGIVPVEPFEREYRERVGRLLVQLAGKAESVERVICGIGQKIK